MLTEDERNRLARWMGWELRQRTEAWGKELAWCKGANRIMSQHWWKPDTEWEQAGLLFEKWAEEAHARKAEVVVRSVYYWHDSSVRWVAYEQDALGHVVKKHGPVLECKPIAVCRAILATLETR